MIVADTQALIWYRKGDASLGRRALRVMQEALARRELLVSPITFWEVALLVRRGRLNYPENVAAWREMLLGEGLIEADLNGEIAMRAALLTGLRNDPCDRLIVATAMDGHRLLTADEEILAWGGGLDRIDARR